MLKPTNNTVPIHPLIQKRWSPRAFSEQPVDRAVLRRLLEAARWSPSCFNEQPWELFVASTQAPERRAKFAGLLNPFNAAWASDAPVLMITAARGNFSRNGNPNMHAGYDLGQAMAWLTVQATAEDLWLHQIGGFDKERAAEMLELPDGIRAMSMVALGHAADPESLTEEQREREMSPRIRRPQVEFVHGDRFGIPWESY